jgi:CubicO group peptidase (beta-lactamase class C family)
LSTDQLDAIVQDHLQRLPAAAVGVAVVGGDYSIAKAYGLARDNKPATVQTRFHVASNTKALLGLAAAFAVEEGALHWTTRVADIVPEFCAPDASARGEVSLLDLLSLRTGLGRAGIADWGMDPELPQSHRVARSAGMPAAGPFRRAFGYSNVSFMAANLLIERACGRPVDSLLRERFFEPLGMDGATLSWPTTTAHLAAPHCLIEGRLEPISDVSGQNYAGAAGIHWSTACALSWLQWCVGALSLSGKATDDAARRALLFHAHMPVDAPQRYAALMAPGGDKAGYAMGWGKVSLAGHDVLAHGGNVPGYRSQIALVPERQVAVAVYATTSTLFSSALAYRILAELLGTEARDTVADFARAVPQRQAFERLAPPNLAPAPLPHSCSFASSALGRGTIDSDRFTLDESRRWSGNLDRFGTQARLRFGDRAFAVDYDEGMVLRCFRDAQGLLIFNECLGAAHIDG